MGHGTEHFPFYAHEAQDREIYDQNDDLSEDRSVHHTGGRLRHRFIHLGLAQFDSPVLMPGEMQPVQHCFYDDHGTIYDQSEIQGAQAHQISGNTQRIHHAYGEHHREWDHGGDDQSCPQVPQKENQHKDHDQRALHQIRLDRSDGAVHHFGAIQESIDDDTFRQGFPDLFHTDLDGIDDRRSVFAFQHQDNSSGYFPFILVCHGPVPDGRADPDIGNVPDQHGHARRGGSDRDLPDLVQVAGESFGADEQQ